MIYLTKTVDNYYCIFNTIIQTKKYIELDKTDVKSFLTLFKMKTINPVRAKYNGMFNYTLVKL